MLYSVKLKSIALYKRFLSYRIILVCILSFLYLMKLYYIIFYILHYLLALDHIIYSLKH